MNEDCHRILHIPENQRFFLASFEPSFPLCDADVNLMFLLEEEEGLAEDLLSVFPAPDD